MDLKGYTTVDEVGEDSQVRNIESFKPTTAAEEIEYLNKILAKIEKCEVKENSKGGKCKLENAISEKDTHRNDSCNNNAVDPITESCSEYVNIEHGNAECERKCSRNESSDKFELQTEKCSLNEIVDERNSDFNEFDMEGYDGLPCADDILTQAESQHSVIQDNKCGHVQNELSTEPNLIMANPSVTDLEDNSRQNSSCTQSNISLNAELEEKLEACSIESITLEVPNENGSSELSSSTMEATVMPVNCSAESSSVLESGHYSAKDTFDFISGEDISGSSNLDSVELGDVSTLSNVVLGDIGSLLKSSADHSNVLEEKVASDCETQVDLSIVKSEPVCSDPGEEFDLKEFCSDPAEEFVLKEHNIKEEPLDYSPPPPTINQEEVLLPVKIFKSEDDSDEQVITPNIRYLVEDHKQYSREEVAAALIISQSSLSPIIDMEMFQNLGRTKLTVTLSRLESMIQCPKQLALEDFNVVQLFRSNYGTSIQEWKKFFSFKANYSVKHTGKRNIKKHVSNVSSDKRKGKKGRKKKSMIEKSHSNAKSNISTFKTEKVKNEVSEEIERDDYQLKHMNDESSNACPINEEAVQLKQDADEESSCKIEKFSELEAESKTLVKGSIHNKKRKRILDQSDLGNAEVRSNELRIRDEDKVMQQCAELSAPHTLQEKNNEKKFGVSHQINVACKACSVNLYDIANDSVYGKLVRNYLKQSSESCRVFGHNFEEPLKESSKENEISPPLLEKEDDSDEGDNSFTGFSPVELKEPMSFLLKDVKDLVANIGKVGFVEEMQPKILVKERNTSETSEIDEASSVKKETSEVSYCRKNVNIEMEKKMEKEDETEIKKLKKEEETGVKLDKGDEFQEKDERRARKRLKLEIEDVDSEMRNRSKERKKVLSEDDFRRCKSETNQEKEEGNFKYDNRKKDGHMSVADFKKNKEDILTSKERTPIASSLSSLATFKIPKKKVTHVLEHKTQEQNSVLRRRGESSVMQKSDRYSSSKQFSIQSKKRDWKERESFNVRNMKKETKPVIPAYTQPPVVEGWAKRAPLPLHSGVYHPQAGFPNMHVRNRFPAPVAHPGPGNTKAHLDTVNQMRMHSGPHIGHVRPPVIANAEYSNLTSSKYCATNIDKPVKQISIPVNVPPPPPLEKLDLNSPKFGQGSGNIQLLPYEPSPVMSYGNSSDGESDVVEICKARLTSAQPPQTNLTDTPNTDITEKCKASLSSALSPVTNVIGTPDIDVTEICKASSCSAQLPLTIMADTPNINTSISVTDTPSEVLSKARQRELHPKMATAHENSSKDKVETTEGVSKDLYQHLDKKQKIKLYEKRKRYYHESKKRYHSEKGERKKVWCKEYEKRKKEYYHLKIYLYKEKKREYMENKLLKKSHEAHSNDEDGTSEVLQKDSELGDETEASEHIEASSNTAVEPEEIPYSPTASPIDYGEEFYSINVQASLLDDTPRKQIVDGKDEEGSTLLNYPTEKLKEMIMQVMNTLNQQSSNEKCSPKNQSADTEVKFKDCESKADADKSQPLNLTSSVPEAAKTSELLPVPPISLPLPLQQTPVTVPPVTVSLTLDQTPLPVPPPSFTHLSLPPLVSSKTALKDSLLTIPVSSVAVSSPQPVPPPAAVSSLTFSSTSDRHLIHKQSSSYLENISSPKTVSTADLPLSAAPVKSPIVEKSHLKVQSEPSVPTSNPQGNFLLPPVSSSSPPVPGKEFVTEFTRSTQEGSEHLSFPRDVFPPLPPSPPPPPPEEEINEKISGSVDESKDTVQEPNASDDMTQVPMDIDSDNETADCRDNGDDNTRSDCCDNVKDHKVMSHSYDSNRDDNEISDCHDSDKGDTEMASCYDSDKDFLALFGISKNKSPSLEKEADKDGIANPYMAKLLKKLMNVANTNKPLDTLQSECGSNAGMKEVTTNFTVDKPSRCLNPATCNQQELVDSYPLKEQDTPSVSSKIVSPAQNKNTEMGSKAREAKDLSLSSYKEDGMGMLFDATQNASFKSEIEIIGMKEPPKNLICVDELLMSVEAADQPPDLQIIYTDLRPEPRDKKTIIRDEVPKYYQKTALAQMLVDKCKDIPLVGLQYVLEVRKDFDMTLDGCYYICAVCSKKMTAHTLVAHIKSVPHRLKFSETHCKHIHDKYGSYELKEWTASLVKEFTMDLAEIEKKMGRHKLAVAFERDISSVLKSLKQKISDISNLSQLQEEKTKVSVGQTPSSVASVAKKVSQPNTPVAENVKEVPLPELPLPKSHGASVLSKKDVSLPSKSPGTKGGSINNKKKDDDNEEEEDDIILVVDTKNAANAKKFSSNGQGFTKRNYRPGPNVRRRSSSRSTTPTLSPRKTWSRSRSRSKSKSVSPKRNTTHSPSNKQMKHSRSPPRKKPDRPIGGKKRRHSRSPVSPHHHSRSRSSSRDIRKRYRTRSRSRSRHRSPYRRKDSRSRRSSPPRREPSEERARRVARRKLEDFREVEMRIKARHKAQQIVYEKAPESHPLYNREWKIFWERRCRELEKDGVDPFLHDFKSEWARFWHHRMKELMENSLKSKRDSILRKLRLDDPDLEENKKSSKTSSSLWRSVPVGENVEKISRIDRSPSPWEQDEGAPVIARNPSPAPEKHVNSTETKGSSKSSDISTSKFEDDFSVIGTLKLLNELEDQLGSFGPAISTLLGKAVDCSQKGEDTLELFKDPDNLVLVRYAREKLSSQISAGILGVTALVRTQMAVERSMWLQSQAEKLANEGKYLGLDIAGIARATLGRDTVQIAQYIAQHLLQVGKSNASEADLQNILYAVLAAHTKLLVETSKKAEVDTPVMERAMPVSAPVMTVSNDPPKEFPSAPSETSEGTKHPLFPSTVVDDTSEVDRKVDDEDEGDSSDRLSGGLSLLQNAYEEENGKEMENLSLEDLRSLLANFSSLNPEEKQALTTYLKKLEATDSKKVMKLREEIQKSAKNAAKTGNVRSALKSGKSSSACSQSVLNTDSNNQVSQQQPSEASQASTGKKSCLEMTPSQISDDRNTRPHFMEVVNQPARVPQQDIFISSSETDAIHVSRGNLGPSASLEPPTHNMPPAPTGMSEMAHDYGPSSGHKPDYRPHHIDQPMFEDGRNRSFPQRSFMERQEPGFGMSEPFKHNVSNHDRNFDSFGYEPVQGQNNPMGPQNFSRYNRPPEPNNPHWQGFGRGGPRMDDHAFPPRDERNYNWFDEGPQRPYERQDFGPPSRPEYPFRGGPRRGHHPNIRQPYRETW